MRPVYETAEHVEMESRAMRHAERIWGCTFLKVRKRYSCFDAYRIGPNGLYQAISEFKCFHHSFGAYPSVFFTLSKVENCLRSASERSLPFELYVWWNDVIGRHPFGRIEDYVVRDAGRFDRGDPLDFGPRLFIPTSKWETWPVPR